MNCKATNQNIEKPLYGLENQLFRIGIVHEVLFLQSDMQLICSKKVFHIKLLHLIQFTIRSS